MRQINVLPRLMEHLTAQTGQVLNVVKASTAARIEPRSGDNYTRLLEALVLIRRLPAWGRTLRSRTVHSPKLHVVDSGLAADLLGITPEKLARRDPAALAEFGHLFETFVVGELLKQASWRDDVREVGHWRTHDGHEVDLVAETLEATIVGFEIKAGPEVDKETLSGLLALRDSLGDQFRAGFLLNTDSEAYRIDDHIYVCPRPTVADQRHHDREHGGPAYPTNLIDVAVPSFSTSSLPGFGYGGAVLVSDLHHFLDMPDDAPAPAKRLGSQLAAIVHAASARPTGTGGRTAVGCMRRPGRRPCEGFVMVWRHANGEIAWSCDSCGDEGVIHGWEGSAADVSGLDDGYAEGDTVALLVPKAVFDLIREVLLLDDACELLVARAEGRPDGVVLIGRTGAFAELVEYVASEANAETNRRRVRQLDEACAALEAALAGE